MILDNVDDRAAVAEVAKLMPRLKGGHVVITARASNFPAGVRKLEVSTLDENAAAQFLLDRTDADRSKSKDDIALARELARELGGLALGLEQAGAHIATDRIGFARYLKLWSESREKALAWADATVTGFRSHAGHDLGDIGRAALAGEPAAARPARLPRPRPGSGFAPRRRRPRRSAGL